MTHTLSPTSRQRPGIAAHSKNGPVLSAQVGSTTIDEISVVILPRNLRGRPQGFLVEGLTANAHVSVSMADDVSAASF
jgi:hypothetical protein